MEENDSVINQQKREIEKLNLENARLENNIESIQLNNEVCIRVKKVAKQQIESIISNPRKLIAIALHIPYLVSAVLACVDYSIISLYYYSETASAKGVFSFGHSAVNLLHVSPALVEIKIP